MSPELELDSTPNVGSSRYQTIQCEECGVSFSGLPANPLEQTHHDTSLASLLEYASILLPTAVLRTIEPISKVEQRVEDCDFSVMLYELNVTVSRE